MKTIYIEQLRAHLTFDAHPVAINLVVAPFSAPLDNDLHWYCRCYPVPGHFSLFRLRVFLVNAYMISYPIFADSGTMFCLDVYYLARLMDRMRVHEGVETDLY